MYICLGGGGVFRSCYFPPKESFSLPLSENHLMVFDLSGGGIEHIVQSSLDTPNSLGQVYLGRLEIPVEYCYFGLKLACSVV